MNYDKEQDFQLILTYTVCKYISYIVALYIHLFICTETETKWFCQPKSDSRSQDDYSLWKEIYSIKENLARKLS